jgi:hypothetical protein
MGKLLMFERRVILVVKVENDDESLQEIVIDKVPPTVFTTQRPPQSSAQTAVEIPVQYNDQPVAINETDQRRVDSYNHYMDYLDQLAKKICSSMFEMILLIIMVVIYFLFVKFFL